MTISPKWAAPPIEETLERADEYKIIVEDETSIEKWSEALSLKNEDIPVWLHPEWSKSQNPSVLHAITSWVKENGPPFRAGFQTHKLYFADQSDDRSLPEASLSHLPD